mgnify:FL=1
MSSLVFNKMRLCGFVVILRKIRLIIATSHDTNLTKVRGKLTKFPLNMVSRVRMNPAADTI